jgi:hypothetical protein
MKRIILWLLVVAGVIAQLSLLPMVRPFGVVPNVIVVLIVLIALETPASVSLVLAVVSGLIIDVITGTNVGLWTGVLVLEVLAIGMVRQAGIEIHGLIVGGVLVAAGIVVLTAVIWLQLLPIVNSWPLGWMMGRLILELVLSWMLMMVLRPLVRWASVGGPGGTDGTA